MTTTSRHIIYWGLIAAVLALLALAEFNLPHILRMAQNIGIDSQVPLMALLLFLALLVLQPLVQKLLPAPEGAALDDLGQDVGRGATARIYVLLALGILCTVAGAIVLLQARNLPSAKGPAVDMDLSRPADPKEGFVKVLGARPLGAVLRYKGAGLDFAPPTRFLPVQSAQQAGAAWLVVQLPDDGLTFDPATVNSMGLTGLLVADILPVSAEYSLREQGTLAKGKYWVLFTNPEELYAQYWRHATFRFFAALLFLLFAAGQWVMLYRQTRHDRQFSMN